MIEKRRRSPAEKKALSYKKDCRNSFGENDKASRKDIPLSKAKGHRADRRKASASLGTYAELDEEAANLLENGLANDIDRCKRWKKSPDRPLGEHVVGQEKKREFRDGRKTWAKGEIAKAKEAGHTSNAMSWRGSDIESISDSQ